MPQTVLSDIQQLQVEKASRTAAQKKIDSQLLMSLRIATGNTAIYGSVPLAAVYPADSSGRIAVDIRTSVNSGTLGLVTGAGGTVTGSYPLSDSIQALVPANMIEQIAADPRIRFIKGQSHAVTNRAAKVTTDAAAPSGTQQPLSPRLQRFKATMQTALAAYDARNCCGAGIILNSGSVNSQGDLAHRANNARAAFGVDGTGIKIGVLSDSFDNLVGAAADVASGDLPGPGNPDGFLTPVTLVGSGDCSAVNCEDEGRAMLQIVHDLAPGAILYFATAFNSDVDFANNIRALGGLAVTAPPDGIVPGGVNIIIDDVSYSNESGLHDGQPAPSNANIGGITQAVNDVTAVGVLYFSSAANSGNKVDGTSGTWEGDFVDGGTTLPPPIAGAGETGNVHIWSGAAVLNALTVGTNDITMQWADPINNTCNDYDMFLLNAAGTALVAGAFSENVQDCTPGQDPFEEIFTGAAFPAGSNIVVVKFAGVPVFLSMSTQRGQTQFNTTGATRGHNAAATGFSVAATPAATAFEPPTPNGPFPGPFVSTNEIEAFSSDGPRQAFFDASGNAYTPGNSLHTGGIIRQKPDFTAADGVNTTLPAATGLNPFYGTSAAAPHAGAIAALVKQAAPLATNAQISAFLTSTALDIMAPGPDAGSGVGILQAFQAVSAAKGGVGIPAFDAGQILVVRLPTPGPLLPGDSAAMAVQIINNGAANATGVSAVLTTSTPCITIVGSASAYPDTAIGASNVNSTPYSFTLAPSCICPTTIDFTLTVTFAGGTSVINFSYVTGPPPVVINGDFNSTPVTPSGYLYSTGTQSTRLSRNAPGTCSAPKAFPGTAGGVLTRRYDAYTFTTGNVSPSYCLNVTLDYPQYNGTTLQVQSGGYIGTFDPTNLGTNYVDDSGGSFTTQSYSFTVPANTPVTITVNEVGAIPSASDPYTLTISGLCGVVAPPTLASAASRKVHGGAGTFDLPLTLVPSGVNHNPTTEPRAGPTQMIVFTFDKPVTGGNATVTEGTATAGAPIFSGNEMQVPLTGVADIQYVTVNVTNVVGADGSTGGTGTARVGLLTGNVLQTRNSTLADLLTIAPQLAQAVTLTTFLLDVFVDGALNVADLLSASVNLAQSLPPP